MQQLKTSLLSTTEKNSSNEGIFNLQQLKEFSSENIFNLQQLKNHQRTHLKIY